MIYLTHTGTAGANYDKMTRWTHRTPYAKVTFYTKSGALAVGSGLKNVKDIVSITTNNKLNEASGTFQIDLVYRPIDGQNTYADVITPMDLVEIDMKRNSTLMIGLVDRIVEKGSISANGVNRRIAITGRSLGAVWLFDSVKYFRGIDKKDLPEDLGKRVDVILKGSFEKNFYGASAIKAIQTIIETYKTIEQEYKDTEENNPLFSLYDRIDYTSDLYTMKGRLIYNAGLQLFEGTLWQYLKSCVMQPLEELWTDSKDGKLILRMRPAPFSLDADDYQDSNDQVKKGGWGELENFVDGMYEGHIIPYNYITQYNISKSHGEAFSYFDIVPNEKALIGYFEKHAAFPPLIDPQLMQSIGCRGMTFSSNILPINDRNALPEGEKAKSYFDWFTDTRNKLYLWYKDNHKYKSGTITVIGNSDYRAGDKITIKTRSGKEIVYYLEGVQNTYGIGRSHTSTLTLTRGATNSDRQAWWTDGVNKIKEKNNNKLITPDVPKKEEKKPVTNLDIKPEIKSDVKEVLDAMANSDDKYSSMNSEASVLLIEATGAAESAYKTKEGGVALSFWQVEPDTALDNYYNYLMSTNEKVMALETAIADETGISKDLFLFPTPADPSPILIENQKFAIAMSRLKYWRVPSPLPEVGQEDTPTEMANYWKQYYNTPNGKGTTEHFIREWKYWQE